MTRRALLLAAVLVVANSIQMVGGVYLLGGRDPSVYSLFHNAVFWLFLLCLLNTVFGRQRPGWFLSRGELLTIYVLISVATSLIGIDMLQILPGLISYPFWHPQGGMLDGGARLEAYFPSWLTVRDHAALTGFYLGESSLYRNLTPWLTPLLWWLSVVVALVVMMGAVVSLIRRRWVEEEKLAFPIIQLPLDLSSTAAGGGLLMSHAFWISCAVAAAVLSLQSLHGLFPAVPFLPLHWDFTTIATERPWVALRWKLVYWSPFLLGLAFLMPIEMSFSMWVFNLFWKGQVLLASQYGWSQGVQGEFPYLEEQCFGAYLGIAVTLLWLDRSYIGRVLRQALRGGKLGSEREALSPRNALIAFALATGFIIFFCHRGGLSYLTALLFIGTYLALCLTITRVRAQLGAPSHDLHWSGPDHAITSLIGPRNLASRELGMFSLLFWFNRAYRSHPMPHLLEALKLSEGGRIEARRLILPVLLTTILASVSFLWVYLHIGYSLGAETPNMSRWTWWAGWETATRLSGWISDPRGPNLPMAWAAAWGAISTIALMAIRLAIPGWPLHPIGYALSGGLATDAYLPPIFVAWLVKSLVLRYGGLRSYRAGLNIAFGLMVGDALAFNLWTFILWLARA